MPESAGSVINMVYPGPVRETAWDFRSGSCHLLNISTGKVYYGISIGKIPARKQHQGWPWEILIDESNLEAIRALYT